jgi:hypothetical protein
VFIAEKLFQQDKHVLMPQIEDISLMHNLDSKSLFCYHPLFLIVPSYIQCITLFFIQNKI